MSTIQQGMRRMSPKAFLALVSNLRRLVCVGAVAVLSACSGNEHDTSLGAVHIGVLPDQSDELLRKRYAPLLGFLSIETGAVVELVVPGSYEELVRLFGEGKIDVALFGGATFVNANALHGAVPLVMRTWTPVSPAS